MKQVRAARIDLERSADGHHNAASDCVGHGQRAGGLEPVVDVCQRGLSFGHTDVADVIESLFHCESTACNRRDKRAGQDRRHTSQELHRGNPSRSGPRTRRVRKSRP